jgi:hypothetical protein
MSVVGQGTFTFSPVRCIGIDGGLSTDRRADDGCLLEYMAAAALIYAYTAYPVENVAEAARMLVSKKPKSLADAAHPAMMDLTWHAEISLNYSLINMTSGICNDKLFPTICPTAPVRKVHFKRFMPRSAASPAPDDAAE